MMRTYSIGVTLTQNGNSCRIYDTMTIVAPNADQACQRAVDSALAAYPSYSTANVSSISCNESNPDREGGLVPGVY